MTRRPNTGRMARRRTGMAHFFMDAVAVTAGLTLALSVLAGFGHDQS